MKTKQEIADLYDAANAAAKRGDDDEADRLHADAVWHDQELFQDTLIRKTVRERHCSREQAAIILGFD